MHAFLIRTVAAGWLLATQVGAAPVRAAAAPAPSLLSARDQTSLRFELNQGQADPHVAFLVRGSDAELQLTADAAVVIRGRASDGRDRSLRMQFVGANPQPAARAAAQLPGAVNYLVGNDPSRWRSGVPTYARVEYQSLYPGVDLVYYGTQGELEYDLVVAPGADPRGIRLGFDTATGLGLDDAGDLLVQAPSGTLRWHQPLVYQEHDGQRQPVDGAFVLTDTDAHQVGFALGVYDPGRPLVIDPVLAYATYLGGSSTDRGRGISVDAAGNAYVTGDTLSTEFPTTPGSLQPSNSAAAFVAKFDPSGNLVYATYLGGFTCADDRCLGDAGTAIAVDLAGNAYVTGTTASLDFPTTTGAFQTQYAGGDYDIFAARLTTDGAGLVYSTYIGSPNRDQANGIAIDAAGTAYITGSTDAVSAGTQHVLVAALNASGSALSYLITVGGRDIDVGNAIAVDPAGNAYVTGSTRSPDFPTTPGAFDRDYASDLACSPAYLYCGHAFVLKVGAGGAIVYSTLLGGAGGDWGRSIAVDAAGSAYVAGHTSSDNRHPALKPFPTTAGAFQPVYGGGLNDGFVTKLTPDGSGLVYSTYLGGSGEDLARAIAVDAAGNAYVTGQTGSADFPVSGAIQATFAGESDIYPNAFVTELNPSGSAVVYSTYLGGSFNAVLGADRGDVGSGIAVDGAGSAYVVGNTTSVDFPTASPAQPNLAGGEDVFVARLSAGALTPLAAARLARQHAARAQAHSAPRAPACRKQPTSHHQPRLPGCRGGSVGPGRR